MQWSRLVALPRDIQHLHRFAILSDAVAQTGISYNTIRRWAALGLVEIIDWHGQSVVRLKQLQQVQSDPPKRGRPAKAAKE